MANRSSSNGVVFRSIRQFLTIFILFMGFSALSGGAALAEGNGLIIKDSAFGVTKTIDRLGIALTRKGITVFKRINHAKAAMSVGIEIPPSVVIIFGTPKIGSPLMQSNPMIGLDLPLKALAWKAADGTVKLAYTDPVWLAKRYGITDRDKVFKGMAGALNKFTDMATKIGGLPKQ